MFSSFSGPIEGNPAAQEWQRRENERIMAFRNSHPRSEWGNYQPSSEPRPKSMPIDPSTHQPITYGGSNIPSGGVPGTVYSDFPFRSPIQSGADTQPIWGRNPQGGFMGGGMFGQQPPTAGGVQSPLPWQQPIMPQPQQPNIGQEDRRRPWEFDPSGGFRTMKNARMQFNLRPPMSMQPNWRQAWNFQQPQQQQQQMPSMQAPLRTSALTSYDWTS